MLEYFYDYYFKIFNGMKIVTVIPLKKGLFSENLTYFSAKDIANGNIVNISVRNKKTLGLVVSSEDMVEAKSGIKKMPFNLKKILEIKGQSIFLKEFLESAFKIGKYFASRKNISITSLIPSVFLKKYDKIAELKNETKKIKNISKNLKIEKLLFQAPLADRISFYKILIRGCFAEKKSVFMVLPTKYDIESFLELLSKGIENFTFSLHGNLSPKKQIEKYEQIITSSHPILILGTAPFLSIPRRDLGTIIVEHENTGIYKMIRKPYLDLRSFAEVFASKINAKFILGDSLLRFESIARREIDGLAEIHPLSFKIDFAGKIEISAPVSGEKKKEFRILTDDSIKEIQNAIAKKENVFIFSLRKGLATMTVCRDCRETVNCEKCSTPVILYLSRDGKKRMFICNRCNTEKNPETVCAGCGGWNLMTLGIGTDTVFAEIKKVFANAKVLKLDKENAKNAKGAEKIAKEFEKSPGSILVGTEMAFFYLKEKIPLSIIASFDSLWSIPNFKMGEKIIQLIISIAAQTRDKLIIQTKNESDPAILALKTENLSSFIHEELEDRKKLNYPPFRRFIKITYLGDKNGTKNAKKFLEEIFKEYNPEIFSGFIAKIKDKYVTNMLIKIKREKWSLPELSANSSIDQNLSEKLLSLPPVFSVNVDPEDII